MDSNGKRQLPPPRTSPASDPPVMGELALPPRKRWRDLAIRREINLEASFFHRPESGPPSFRRIFAVQLELTVRRVVREELQRIIYYYSNLPPRPPPNQNNQVRYKLVFQNKIKSPIFTTDIIEGQNGEPINIAIYDTYERKFISQENPLSSAKLKIVTLDAEHWKNERESWTQDVFKNSILSDREGKVPILSGETNFRLENGVKMVNKLVVEDNSSWTKSGFSLGVMVENGNERVLEGISEPFRVKDRRGKALQKPNRLLLTHNVRSLKRIGKDRALILENNNIKTVDDFLFYYHKDKTLLRQTLGIKSESNNEWKIIVDHAMECNTEFQTVYIGNQNIISNPNVHQTDQFALPNNNNFDNDMHANRGGEFRISQEAPSNLFMGTSGTHILGSSSSQPNPSEDNIIVLDQASQFENLFSGDVSNGWGNIGFSEIVREQSQSTFTGLIANGEPSNLLEDIFTTHDSTSISILPSILPNETDVFMNTNNVNVNGNNVSVNNGSSHLLMNSGPQFVGSSSSQQYPFEHNIITQGILATHDSIFISILPNDQTDLFSNMNANNVNMNNVIENLIRTDDEFSISHEASNNFLSRTSQTQFVGSSSFQPNPSESNIIPQGVSNGGIGLSGIAWEQSHFTELWLPSSEAYYDMEDILRSLEPIPDAVANPVIERKEGVESTEMRRLNLN